jgi:hypothetical protein
MKFEPIIIGGRRMADAVLDAGVVDDGDDRD